VLEVYNENIYLTPEDILNKEFKIDARGFRPQEVDKFLDMVIRDYTEYNSIIKRLEKELKDSNDDNRKLQQEIRNLKEKILIMNNDEANNTKQITNLDIIKRISQLEKVVFGKEE